LIIPILLSSSLFVTFVKDTVWWNTPGGNVTEHRDRNVASCSLTLYNDDGSVTFEWDDPGKVLVTAVDKKWAFPDTGRMPVAMQLGDVWLSNHGGSAVIDAVGHGRAIGFVANQAVDDLLRQAGKIVIKTKGVDLTITLTRSKTRVLLSRMNDCRQSIRK